MRECLRHVSQVSTHLVLISCILIPWDIRKKVLVKIFAGPIWEGRLVEFVGIFTKRREEFEFTLTIHTTIGVDAANLKLDTVNERTAELTRR